MFTLLKFKWIEPGRIFVVLDTATTSRCNICWNYVSFSFFFCLEQWKSTEYYKKIHTHCHFSHLLLMGDFNFLQECATTSSSNSISSQFLNAVQDSFLTQHVLLPTHLQVNQQSSLLDLVIQARSQKFLWGGSFGRNADLIHHPTAAKEYSA